MTRDEINRLIQDNELFHGTVSIGVIMDINHLERLVDLVTAAEREACEKVAEQELLNTSMLTSMPPKSSAAWNILQGIRARGQE